MRQEQTSQFPTIFVRLHKAFLSPQKQPPTAYDSTGQPTACRRFLSLEQSTPRAGSSGLADLELLPCLGWTELPKLLYAIFTHMPLSNPVTALVCQAGLRFCLWSAVDSLFARSRYLLVSPQEKSHSLQEIFATCYGYILIFAHVYFVNNEKNYLEIVLCSSHLLMTTILTSRVRSGTPAEGSNWGIS